MGRRHQSIVTRSLAFATGLLLVAGSPGRLHGPASIAVIDAAPAVRPGEFIAALIDGRDASLGFVSREERSELQALYRPVAAPLWMDATGRATSNMHDALTVLSHAPDEGLSPGAYHEALIARLTACAEAAPAARDVARIDVAVSAAMLRYLRDAHMGRIDPRTVGFRFDAARDRHDFAALLRGAIAAHRLVDLAADLRPPLAQYRWLRAVLPRYRSLAADPTFITPQPARRTVRPGVIYEDAELLRRELVALGDLTPSASATDEPGRYAGALVEGVKHFQSRHGLAADGALGRSTIAALRVPLSWRVRQIELGLERLRWVPHLEDERLIALNIPMFRLWAWTTIPSDGSPLFGMDAIVGRALSTQTPVFAEEMREVIFRPYWNVPRSILRREVLPKLLHDPDYLRREDMEIVRDAGDNAARVGLTAATLAELGRGTLRVRQRPGAKNALGLVKFVFPNSDDVYMHGTPAQGLFAKERRDFSHGCVRVADPIALAEWVLQDQAEWTRGRIQAAVNGHETIRVKLARPIQVILFYTTAAVMAEDGTIRFADDIYRHDATLDRALTARHRVRLTTPR